MNPIRDESVTAARPAALALRVVVALQCLGIAWWQHATETAIFSLLWDTPELGGWGWSESSALLVEQIATWALVAAAGLTLVRPCLPVLLPVALWQVAHVLAKWLTGGEAWTELGSEWRLVLLFAEQSVRIVAPLALILLDPLPRRLVTAGRVNWTMWGQRLAVAATFIGHGYKALLHQPIFVDYIIAAGSRLLSVDVSETAARQMLNVIGVVDMIVAVLLLGFRWRWVAAYMAFWGVVTAFSRIVYGGWPAGFETLLRAANGGAPLVLLLYWSNRRAAKLRTHTPGESS